MLGNHSYEKPEIWNLFVSWNLVIETWVGDMGGVVKVGRVIVTYPHEKVNEFYEVRLGQVPLAGRNEPWFKSHDSS